jgi:hypothetical protein
MFLQHIPAGGWRFFAAKTQGRAEAYSSAGITLQGFDTRFKGYMRCVCFCGLSSRTIDFQLDICNMGLFFCAWFCTGCGLEICGFCYSAVIGNHDYSTLRFHACGTTQHGPKKFIPTSYFTSEQVNSRTLLQAMAVIRRSSTVSCKCRRNGEFGYPPCPLHRTDIFRGR